MAFNDPIADFLTRIRNSVQAQHRFVDIDWSTIKENLAQLLQGQGFIESYLIKKESASRGKIRIFLKYSDSRKPVIQGIRRMSKPGLRRYVRHEEIPNFFGGMGLSIVSTSQGLLPGQEAKKRKIGGELLCLVW